MRKISIICMALTGILRLTAQDDITIVKETVSKSEIEGHIYFLASDELKGRKTGTEENKIAAQYLASMLRGYGVQPVPGLKGYFQEVNLKKTSGPVKISLSIANFTPAKMLPLTQMNTTFSGKVIYANYGTAEDLAKLDVKGKLVLTKAGDGTSNDVGQVFRLAREKRKAIQEKGGLGMLEVADFEEGTWDALNHYFTEDRMTLYEGETPDDEFPFLWISDDNAKLIKMAESKREVQTDLKIDGIHTEIVTSQNVVGMVEGTDPKLKDEFIIYSAHYDHVGIGAAVENDSIYNGARDNAVGSVTVLSAAENIAAYPTKRSALFILFTGEEKGLLGSKWYVEHPALPLNQMVFCFNSDNGGYNDTTIATIIGLGRTTAEKNIIDAAKVFELEAIDDPAKEQGLFDRSDNVNFAAKGIPAPTYSLGFTAFDEEINKYYHQVTDQAETLDYDYLVKFFRSYVLACRYIANNPQTPFWLEGDKYYEAGKTLYGNK